MHFKSFSCRKVFISKRVPKAALLFHPQKLTINWTMGTFAACFTLEVGMIGSYCVHVKSHSPCWRDSSSERKVTVLGLFI